MRLVESVGRSLLIEEFTVKVEDGWVHLYDGQDVLLSVPQSTWEGLTKSVDKAAKKASKGK